MNKRTYESIPDHLEAIGEKIVHAAFLVHNTLGPGLLERVYETCFYHELSRMGLQALRQIDIPIVYDDIIFNKASGWMSWLKMKSFVN